MLKGKGAMNIFKKVSITLLLIFSNSCNENYHLNLSGATATDVELSLALTASGDAPMIGSCFPDGSTVTISSQDFDASVAEPLSCLCEDGAYDCGVVNIPGTGPNGQNPIFDVVIQDPNGNVNESVATVSPTAPVPPSTPVPPTTPPCLLYTSPSPRDRG